MSSGFVPAPVQPSLSIGLRDFLGKPDSHSSENLELLSRLQRGLPVVERPELGRLVRPSDDAEPIQRWFRYREGYTVELCRRIMKRVSGTVIDPFCGFGSTLLAAKAAGVPAIGLDVNPLAAFVSRAKTRKYSVADRRAIHSGIRSLKRLTRTSRAADAPVIRILPKLFQKDILSALLVFRRRIDGVESDAAREFLLLAWIAILEDVSNVFREGNGVKYRNRIRRGNEYSVQPFEEWARATFPRDKFGFVRGALLEQLDMMVTDLEEDSASEAPKVLNEDVRSLGDHAPAGSADLVLFSPPYCNCFNYIKAYKLELWMGGFIRQYPDIKRLTARGIRSRIESLLDPVTEPYPAEVEQVAQLMSGRELWSPQLPDVVRGYFADLQQTMSGVHRVLRKGGQCVIVVGNSAYGGTLVPTDLLISRIALKAGFEVSEVAVARHLTTSSQQRESLTPMRHYMRESVITLRKTHA